MIEKLKAIAAKRTKTPWEARNNNILNSWLVYPNEKRSVLSPNPEEPRQYPLKDCQYNAEFIAMASNCFDEMLAVIACVDKFVRKFGHSEDCDFESEEDEDGECSCGMDMFENSLEALHAKIKTELGE